MTGKRPHIPLYLRATAVASTVGVVGLIVRGLGQAFVDIESNPQLHDSMPAIGNSILQVASLVFMATFVATLIDSIRTRRFLRSHLIVLVIAAAITLVAGIDGAYPR